MISSFLQNPQNLDTYSNRQLDPAAAWQTVPRGWSLMYLSDMLPLLEAG
jgi:hypothetical protein